MLDPTAKLLFACAYVLEPKRLKGKLSPVDVETRLNSLTGFLLEPDMRAMPLYKKIVELDVQYYQEDKLSAHDCLVRWTSLIQVLPQEQRLDPVKDAIAFAADTFAVEAEQNCGFIRFHEFLSDQAVLIKTLPEAERLNPAREAIDFLTRMYQKGLIPAENLLYNRGIFIGVLPEAQQPGLVQEAIDFGLQVCQEKKISAVNMLFPFAHLICALPKEQRLKLNEKGIWDVVRSEIDSLTHTNTREMRSLRHAFILLGAPPPGAGIPVKVSEPLGDSGGVCVVFNSVNAPDGGPMVVDGNVTKPLNDMMEYVWSRYPSGRSPHRKAYEAFLGFDKAAPN